MKKIKRSQIKVRCEEKRGYGSVLFCVLSCCAVLLEGWTKLGERGRATIMYQGADRDEYI